jgi:hypothetical protein
MQMRARKPVNGDAQENDISILLNRVDDTGRMGVKR